MRFCVESVGGSEMDQRQAGHVNALMSYSDIMQTVLDSDSATPLDLHINYLIPEFSLRPLDLNISSPIAPPSC